MERRPNPETNVLDAVMQVAEERRILLTKLRAAVKAKDLQATFQCAEMLVGCCESVPSKNHGAQ